jgi:FtsP/CotA-like multicopper oxidase with cupredoxin domain
MQQVAAGLAGAIIIEGGLDDLPAFRSLPERLLVLHGPAFGPTGLQYLVNGQVIPTIDIRPGQTQRWRILNASANNFFDLQLAGHQLHRLAVDGNVLPNPISTDVLLLGPGERADVLVQGAAAGGYELRSLAWGEGGQAQPDILLATVESAGEAQEPAPLPTTLIPLAEPLVDLSTVPIDRRREITFQELKQSPYFAIDGKAFDPDRVDQTVVLGTTEEWVIHNASPEWHPFHIHVNDFQPISVNGEPIAPHYEDTIPVPPNGDVVVRMRFLDFTGKFVYHCHVLGHEDAGMMGVIEVVAPDADRTAAATPAG